jgi:hypothetical protein
MYNKEMITKPIALLATLLIFWAGSAMAFLQSDSSSLGLVKTMIAAKDEKVTTYASHTVHEYAVHRGSIRAYVSETGQVFAYTGHNQMGYPPLSLLGNYLGEYRAAVKQAHLHGRRALRIQTAHIRASISGPQGSLSWSISLQNLPVGVSPNDIR